MSKADVRIKETLEILELLGLPKAQHNERSALTLLALLNLGPNQAWTKAEAHMIGITPIMTFADQKYGRHYAPNTRETFRRQTMHQFVDAGLALYNPDKPDRPVNSPKAVYQIEPNTLALLRQYGTPKFKEALKAYLKIRPTLSHQYARERDMKLIPVTFNGDYKVSLSPGKHSELITQIIKEFAPRFTPDAQVIYVGDTGNKWGYFDKVTLKTLGVEVDGHGKMPDVVMYYKKKGWLILVEAVTSHGPVDAKRHKELEKLFSSATLVRLLRFERFKLKLRNAILSTINGNLTRFISDPIYNGKIQFNGLPTEEDIERAEKDLIEGSRRFNDIIDPFLK